MSDGLRTTPLHGRHVELGAKMVPFAGFEMPLHYEGGMRAGHQAVRERAGVFDVSHMGEVEVRGGGAVDFLRHLAVNDVARTHEGQAQYSALCTPGGGVLDDLVVYRFPDDRFLLVVNAANRDVDLAWIREHARDFEVEVVDRSDETGLVALQGPRAREILSPLTDVNLSDLPFYRFREGRVADVPTVVSRTGYTGEDGFELYADAADTPTVWDALLEAGEEHGLEPTGLGARDSLRLEMGYALHGNDLDTEHTPLEAGLDRIVRLDEGRTFIGSDALREQKQRGVRRKLVGLGLRERGFPRPGYSIVHADEAVGSVTSGTVSPTLDRGIALGYVPVELAEVGEELAVRIRNRDVPASVEELPFYTGGSLRR